MKNGGREGGWQGVNRKICSSGCGDGPRLRGSGAFSERLGLGKFRDLEAFAIVPVEHSVCGFVADEALRFRVNLEV